MIVTDDEIFNPVKGKQQELIELFVGFYGEQWRDKITNRIQNIEFLFIDNRPVKKINQFYDTGITRCERMFCEEIGFNTSYTQMLNLKAKLQDLYKDIEKIKSGDKVKRQVDTNDIDIVASVIDLPIIEDINTLALGDNYIAILRKVEECINIWENKYATIYSQLQQEKLQKVKPYIEQDIKYLNALDDNKNGIKELAGNYLKDQLLNMQVDNQSFIALREAFYNILCLGQDGLKDKFAISPQYIDLFKALGFDYGDDFNKYVNNKQLMDKVFDNQLLKEFNELIVKKRIAIMNENQMFQYAFDKVKHLDIKGGNYSIMSSIYNYMFCTRSRLSAFCSPYIAQDDTLKAVCVCPLGIELNDQTLIHEIGHFIQSDIIRHSENSIEIKCGFDMISYEIDENDNNFDIQELVMDCLDVNANKRSHEIFNEVVHDLLMTWLTQEARRQGLTIGRGKIIPSGYAEGFKMLGQFLYNNEEKIKQLQMQPQMNKIYNMLGEENYDQLSKAVHDCVMIYMRDGATIKSEISNVANWDTASRIELSQMDREWSSSTKKYLDTYVQAQAVLDRLKQGQQFKV